MSREFIGDKRYRQVFAEVLGLTTLEKIKISVGSVVQKVKSGCEWMWRKPPT